MGELVEILPVQSPELVTRQIIRDVQGISGSGT